MPQSFAVADLLKTVDREIGFRQRVYPRWINQRKISAENAGIQLINLRGVREYIVRGEALRLTLEKVQATSSMSAEEVDRMFRATNRELIVMYPAPPEPGRG